eukprot:2898595-Alexandrium_andersonii.AAC.1
MVAQNSVHRGVPWTAVFSIPRALALGLRERFHDWSKARPCGSEQTPHCFEWMGESMEALA